MALFCFEVVFICVCVCVFGLLGFFFGLPILKKRSVVRGRRAPGFLHTGSKGKVT